MRPIERGNCPADSDGVTIIFHKYQDAQAHLIARLGEYCSYCERPISNADVEHILPKKWHPECEKEWNNFLLACKNCNSIKGYPENMQLNNYYWPDKDNTARAFVYRQGGTVEVHPQLAELEQAKARRTMQLTGLDRRIINPYNKDTRFNKRKEVWKIAEDQLATLEETDTPKIRDLIVQVAQGRGFWSVWMTVFQKDKDMLRRFIDAFPGTCPSCFDEQYRLIPRPGGAL